MSKPIREETMSEDGGIFNDEEDQDEEEAEGENTVAGEGEIEDDDEDEEEPGDVHAPCPPPSPTIGREIVDEEPFPEGVEDPEAETEGESE